MAVNGSSNGHSAGGLVRLLKMAEKLEADAAAIRRTVGLLGGAAVESSAQRAETTLAGALKIDKARRGGAAEAHNRVAYDKPSPEERQRRRDLVVKFVARRPNATIGAINDELTAHGARLTRDQARRIMIELRPVIERTGERTASRYRIRQGKAKPTDAPPARGRPKKKRVWKPKNNGQSVAFDGSTMQKAIVVLGLIRDADGGVITTKDLVPKAREAGVAGLTGMVNYVRKGWLKRTRTRSGDNAWRFVKMPPTATPEAPSES